MKAIPDCRRIPRFLVFSWHVLYIHVVCVRSSSLAAETTIGHLVTAIIWTAARQNRRLWSACASVQSDQSSLSAWRNFTSLATQWVFSEDWLDCADVQADLSLCWVHVILLVLMCCDYISMAWGPLVTIGTDRPPVSVTDRRSTNTDIFPCKHSKWVLFVSVFVSIC